MSKSIAGTSCGLFCLAATSALYFLTATAPPISTESVVEIGSLLVCVRFGLGRRIYDCPPRSQRPHRRVFCVESRPGE